MKKCITKSLQLCLTYKKSCLQKSFILIITVEYIQILQECKTIVPSGKFCIDVPMKEEKEIDINKAFTQRGMEYKIHPKNLHSLTYLDPLMRIVAQTS